MLLTYCWLCGVVEIGSMNDKCRIIVMTRYGKKSNVDTDLWISNTSIIISWVLTVTSGSWVDLETIQPIKMHSMSWKLRKETVRLFDDSQQLSDIWTPQQNLMKPCIGTKLVEQVVYLTNLYTWVHSQCIRCCKHKCDSLACSYKSHPCHSLHCWWDIRWYLVAQNSRMWTLSN